MNCEFTDPLDLGGGDWEFSKATCLPETLELVESVSTEAEFYLDKRINYGDFLIIIFFSLFAIFIICKEIGKFIFSH